MRERIDRAIEMAAIEIIPWRGKLAQFVSDVVRQWDTRSFTERLELAVGRDLQCIRITGTLVSGLVGCLLHLLSAALEWRRRPAVAQKNGRNQRLRPSLNREASRLGDVRMDVHQHPHTFALDRILLVKI